MIVLRLLFGASVTPFDVRACVGKLPIETLRGQPDDERRTRCSIVDIFPDSSCIGQMTRRRKSQAVEM